MKHKYVLITFFFMLVTSGALFAHNDPVDVPPLAILKTVLNLSEDQAGEIISRIQLDKHIRPFTRCLLCNGITEKKKKKAILDRIPPKTSRLVNEFRRCTGCGKIYWQGAHSEGLNESIAFVMSRLDRTGKKHGG